MFVIKFPVKSKFETPSEISACHIEVKTELNGKNLFISVKGGYFNKHQQSVPFHRNSEDQAVPSYVYTSKDFLCHSDIKSELETYITHATQRLLRRGELNFNIQEPHSFEAILKEALEKELPKDEIVA